MRSHRSGGDASNVTSRPEPTLQRTVLAVEIRAADVQFIERLFRHVQERRRRARFDMQHDPYRDGEREQLIKALYLRLGAASVLPPSRAEPVVPLTEDEITVVDKMRQDLDYFNSYLIHGDPMACQADSFLARLYLLAGRAHALRLLGGVAVFREPPELPVSDGSADRTASAGGDGR